MVKYKNTFAKEIHIGPKTVRENGPCFIIAEAGLNHNGNLELAKKLIDVAVEAGADAVKFQTFKAEEENTKKLSAYLEMIKKMEFGEEDHKVLIDYCQKKNIIFLSTPSEEISADLLQKLKVPAFKIASNDIVTTPMLVKIAKFGKPMIVSTGMAELGEIGEAVDVIRSSGNRDLILLHCTSSYPTPLKDLNLRVMETLKKEFGSLVGFSDHSEGLEAAPLAVLLGAVIIEKHFTLDKNMSGPDHKMSLLPKELKELVKRIRHAEKMRVILGSFIKKPTAMELKVRKITRKGIVARRAIKKGEVIKISMLAYKRPALGISPKFYRQILGRKTKVDLAKDEFIEKKFLS